MKSLTADHKLQMSTCIEQQEEQQNACAIPHICACKLVQKAIRRQIACDLGEPAIESCFGLSSHLVPSEIVLEKPIASL